MSYIIYRDSNHLEHHGILGQKWGVRRYQNPDGTLTEEGKKRYLGSTGRYDSYRILSDYARGGFAKRKVARDLVLDKLQKTTTYSDVERTITEYLKKNPRRGDIYGFFDPDKNIGLRSETKLYREIANILNVELKKHLDLTDASDPMLGMAQNFVTEIWGRAWVKAK